MDEGESMNEYVERVKKIMDNVANGVTDNTTGILSLHFLAMEVCNDQNLSDEDAYVLLCLITDRQSELGIDYNMVHNIKLCTMDGLEGILKS